MSIGSLENPPWGSVLIDSAKRMSQDYQNWFLTLLSKTQAGNTVVGTVNLTGQSASIATTTVPGAAGLSAGQFQVSYYLRVTTVAGVSSSAVLTLTYTNGAVLQTITSATVNGNTTTSTANDVLLVKSDAAAGFSYAVTYASNPATVMKFELLIKVMQIP